MADNRVQFRKTEVTNAAFLLAKEKWPEFDDSEVYRRIIEQWKDLQDAGTSKTRKMADMDARLAECTAMLLQLSDNTATIADRVTKLGELFDKIYPVIVEMKEALAAHGFDAEDTQ